MIGLLTPLAVVTIAVWMLVEALDHVSKTGDIVFALVALVLAVIGLLLAWRPDVAR